MARLRYFLVTLLVLTFSTGYLCKIVLPHKLRYLENMLNAEVVAKAAKIRQQMEANPNMQDSDKTWPLLLSQLQMEKTMFPQKGYNNMKAFGNHKY